MITGRGILVMDDEDRWRDELGSILRRAGYSVDTAQTRAEALTKIKGNLYHVLVLDIRMVDPDESNTEGMEMLGELEELGLLDSLTVIMLSAYGTREQMRQAFRHYRVADFQTKGDFRGRAFVESVNQIFAESVRWNSDLEIIWQDGVLPTSIVVNMAIRGERIRRDTDLQKRVALELDDLLRRLFHDAKSILVSPLQPGYSGAGVLKVQPFFPSGKGEAVVVKFGDFAMMDMERQNYTRYVKPFIVGARHTALNDYRRTPMLGGIIYSLLGNSGGEIQTFGGYYQKATITEIRRALDQIFLASCANWYINRSSVHPLNLTEEYKKLLPFTIEGLQKALRERLNTVQGDERLVFANLSVKRSFVNPILALDDRQFIYPTYKCITHGDLNDGNILVGDEGHTWLIDFLRTGEGHILRDIAELESVIRLQALSPEEASLDEWLALEDLLASCTQFRQVECLLSDFPTENVALTKVFATCVHLRAIAHKIMAQNGQGDMREYYVALMYFALNTIRFYSLPKIQREHALLSASILAERLGLGTDRG